MQNWDSEGRKQGEDSERWAYDSERQAYDSEGRVFSGTDSSAANYILYMLYAHFASYNYREYFPV